VTSDWKEAYRAEQRRPAYVIENGGRPQWKQHELFRFLNSLRIPELPDADGLCSQAMREASRSRKEVNR
jgi:hypothetical protein